MKSTLFGLVFAIISINSSIAQCNTDDLATPCNAKLGTFTFIKNYKIEPSRASNGVVEVSYVFSKDTQYFVSVCDGKSENPAIEVTLLDSNKKKLATNKEGAKFYPGLAYKCTATGIYYITYDINTTADKCAISALGFKK